MENRFKMSTLRDKYDTEINIIGGLRNSDMILHIIDDYFNNSTSLNNMTPPTNALTLRTEKSRVRIQRAIKKGFLEFINPAHYDLMQAGFTGQVPFTDKIMLLVWQFALNNRLFRELTSTVFVKTYFSGRTTISKEDIIACLKEIIAKEKTEDRLKISWSESTIHTLSTKYLNLMGKFDFLNAGKIKSFNLIHPSSQAQVLFLYFAALHNPEQQNLFKNAFLPLGFLSKEDLLERLKRLSLKGYFHMSHDGVALNIELIHPHKEICHVLYA